MATSDHPPQALPGAGELARLARRHGTDKWGEHWYADRYESLLAHRRAEPLRILEIGIGGYDDPAEGGASLRMWADYFPSATVVGLDVAAKHGIETDRIRCVQGDQGDTAFLHRLAAEHGPFDLVVDDGCHRNDVVIGSFLTLFPALNDGGLYAIEDVQTSYWTRFGGTSSDLVSPTTTLGFVKTLVDALNHEEIVRPGYEPTYLDRNVVALHLFHNLVVVEKGGNDEGSNVLVANAPPVGEQRPIQRAAGAVAWRPRAGGIDVLLVPRPGGAWTFPSVDVDVDVDGEPDGAAALRALAATGVSGRLGPHAGTTSHRRAGGGWRRVVHWRIECAASAEPGAGGARWFDVEAARDALTDALTGAQDRELLGD